MKKNLLNIPAVSGVPVSDAEVAEMVLNRALREYRRRQILKEIDQSLTNRNKEEFMRLTEELKAIS